MAFACSHRADDARGDEEVVKTETERKSGQAQASRRLSGACCGAANATRSEDGGIGAR